MKMHAQEISIRGDWITYDSDFGGKKWKQVTLANCKIHFLIGAAITCIDDHGFPYTLHNSFKGINE